MGLLSLHSLCPRRYRRYIRCRILWPFGLGVSVFARPSSSSPLRWWHAQHLVVSAHSDRLVPSKARDGSHHALGVYSLSFWTSATILMGQVVVIELFEVMSLLLIAVRSVAPIWCADLHVSWRSSCASKIPSDGGATPGRSVWCFVRWYHQLGLLHCNIWRMTSLWTLFWRYVQARTECDGSQLLTLCHRDAEVISSPATVDTLRITSARQCCYSAGQFFFWPRMDSLVLPIHLKGSGVTGTHTSFR